MNTSGTGCRPPPASDSSRSWHRPRRPAAEGLPGRQRLHPPSRAGQHRSCRWLDCRGRSLRLAGSADPLPGGSGGPSRVDRLAHAPGKHPADAGRVGPPGTAAWHHGGDFRLARDRQRAGPARHRPAAPGQRDLAAGPVPDGVVVCAGHVLGTCRSNLRPGRGGGPSGSAAGAGIGRGDGHPGRAGRRPDHAGQAATDPGAPAQSWTDMHRLCWASFCRLTPARAFAVATSQPRPRRPGRKRRLACWSRCGRVPAL